jgi:SAM-dependent methyltransferase
MESLAENSSDFSPTVRLIREVQTHYAIGPTLAAAYLSYWCNSRKRLPNSLEEILALPAPEPLWFGYALSTNERGMGLRKLIQPYLRPWFARYLDVGCGFGGCMVAFARLGYEAWGVDLDPVRVRMARANLTDHSLPLNAHDWNFLDAGVPEKLGRFDLITCIDVIEHVLDVPKTLERVVSMLNPGGVVLFEIPNRNFIPFVNRDGHFELFGIVQLDREAAIEYHKKFFSFEYDVGDYYEKSFYEGKLRDLGCEVFDVDAPLHAPLPFTEVEDRIQTLKVDFQSFLQERKAQVGEELSGRIAANVEKYLEYLEADYRKAYNASCREQFATRYLTDFWTIAARKRR